MIKDDTVYKRDSDGKRISKNRKTSVKNVRVMEMDSGEKRSISIGRGPNNTIVINNDPLVSRTHAVIEQDGHRLTIKDKNSTNGTYVNNTPVTRGKQHQLKDGDEIRVGKTVLKVKKDQITYGAFSTGCNE